jgi:hypothetical protein
MNRTYIFKFLLFTLPSILVFGQIKLSEEKTSTKPNVLFTICDDLNDCEGTFNTN